MSAAQKPAKSRKDPGQRERGNAETGNERVEKVEALLVGVAHPHTSSKSRTRRTGS